MTMEYINAKSILVPKNGEWFGCDYSANLYRGCNHGCIYCDGRSDCYAYKKFGNVTAKRDALSILENELLHKKRKKGVIALGTLSDSYNPFEKEIELTRNALKLIDRYGFGVSIDTKSDLILRDKDILKSISSHSPVSVKFSVSTPYDDLSKKIEPKVCSVKKRFAALAELSACGIYTGVLLMPVLPFICDDSAAILTVVDKAKAAGCKFVYAGDEFGVTMRDSQRAYFYNKAEKIFPGIKEKYESTFGEEYLCVVPQNELLYKAFCTRCKELGLKYDMKEIIEENKAKYETRQISLFDF